MEDSENESSSLLFPRKYNGNQVKIAVKASGSTCNIWEKKGKLDVLNSN